MAELVIILLANVRIGVKTGLYQQGSEFAPSVMTGSREDTIQLPGLFKNDAGLGGPDKINMVDFVWRVPYLPPECVRLLFIMSCESLPWCNSDSEPFAF